MKTFSAILTCFLGMALSAAATVITVTNINDSGPGSLRQALLTANLSINEPDLIQFNIAGAGPHTITPLTPLPTITDPLTIDGYTQSGASTNTLAGGDNAVLKILVLEALVIDTTNSTVRGLAIRQIQLGPAPGLKGSNVVEGCFVGLDTSGTNSLASAGPGVFVQTPKNRIGGTTTDARNIISGKGAAGVEIFGDFASNNIVQGNYIGTDRNGTSAIGNTDRALVVNMMASSTTIGGTVAGAGNLISGNLDRGITLDGANNVVQGNFIGTDVTGTQPLGNARTGVEIGGPGNTVGGTNSGAGNVIAFNGVNGGGTFTTNGVDVKAGATGFAILGNSIFDNRGLGIDVNADELVTAPLPGLTLASNTTTATFIRGTNTPSVTFRLELFANVLPDPSGYGEGKTFLGATNVTTDVGGNFSLTWPTALNPGLFLTATASGATEFSRARMVIAAGGTNSWTNILGGKWEGATNWSLNVAPYPGHTLVQITNAASKTVTNDSVTASSFPGSMTISNLLISAPGGATNTLLLTQGAQTALTILSNLTLNSGGAVAIENGALLHSGSFGSGFRLDGNASLAGGLIAATNGVQTVIGSDSRGALTVSDGTLQAYYVIVGANAGSDGTWNIAGGTNIIAGGAFDMADSLTATGTVRVTGGRLEVPNAYVGLFGNGGLFVSNGVVQCAGTALVGSQPGAQGSFIAAGGTSTFGGMQVRESLLSTGSVLVAGTAVVRVNGALDNSGSVTVAGGDFSVLGQVTSEAAGNAIVVTGGQFAATNDNSFLTSVTVSNGTFLARDVFLGNSKFGTFNLAGGTVGLLGSFNGFTVGGNGGTGVVSQTGGQILLTNTDLNVGGLFSPAIGQMTISSGATVASNVYVGGQGGGTGVVTVAGGTLAATNLFVGSSSWQNQLIANNGATVLVGANSFLGLDTGANSNSATLADPGTRWLISSNFFLGSNGALSRLVISNGALLQSGLAFVGSGPSSSNNVAIVTGSGSVWTNASLLRLGGRGQSNQLIVSNGATVHSVGGFLGENPSSSNNQAVITGPGSLWRSLGSLFVGSSSSGNRVVVTNGGRMLNGTVSIGSGGGPGGSDNEVIVTGAGSSWTNLGTVSVGVIGNRNRLVISNGGFAFQTTDIRMSENPSSTNNLILVDGGTLQATDPVFGILDLRRGTNILNAGLIDVTQLLLTNALGFFQFNGGTLRTTITTNGNGRVFTVGNGTSTATLQLQGGTHVFSNNLVIASNGFLTGNGTIVAGVTNAGSIAPGGSPGSIIINGPLVLSSSSDLRVELGGYTPATEFDSLSVTGTVALGGRLSVSVTNNFAALITNGSSFTLLTATNPLTGAFTNVASGGTLTTTDGYARFTVLYAGSTSLRLTNLGAVDTDGDGLPDWWEDQFGLNKNNPADAALDSDGDGASNLNEFLAGTNPTNAASNFHIVDLQRETDNIRITWSTVGGKSYVVQTNATQQGGLGATFADFSPLITEPGTGEATTDLVHTGAATNASAGYYRVRLGP